MPGLVILILVLILFFSPKLLPRLGAWLGGRSRKPFRQARWMWSSFAGTEDEAIRAEQDYGRECAGAFAKQFSGGISRADQELASTVGARLAGAVKDARREFRFTVVSSPMANAFALPGGYVFVTGSLLRLCAHDRDETAFFLAHEMEHILRGHAREHLTANAFLNAVASRIPAAGQMLRQVLSKGYSQSLELEADLQAVRLAAAAGFDARASVRALKRLAQVSPETPVIAEYLSSHPPVLERVRALENHLAANG